MRWNRFWGFWPLGLLIFLLSGASFADGDKGKGKIPYFENETFESNFRKGVQESVTLRDGRVVELHADYTWGWAQAPKVSPADDSQAAAPNDQPVVVPRTAREAVEVWDTTLDTEEVDSQQAVRLFIHYKNNTTKKVVGVSITVKITNSFGKTLYEFSKDDEVAVNPMEQMKNDAYFVWKNNPYIDGEPYDRMWESAQNGTGKVSVAVRKVVFEDGTVLTNEAQKKAKN